MPDESSLSKIQNLLNRFIELDANASKEIQASNTEAAATAIFEGIQIERKLRTLLAFEGHLAWNDQALDTFRRQEFWLQAAIDELRLETDDRWDPELPSILDSHLNYLFDFTDPDWTEPINKRLLSVQVLLTKRPLPDWVVSHLHTVRRCYALEMREAAWVFLRALVEAVSFECLSQRGILNQSSKILILLSAD